MMTRDEMNTLIEDQTPAWIEDGLTVEDIQAIQEGGCESGAYMPAVTYIKARETMAEHGDDVLEFLEEYEHVSHYVSPGMSWSQIQCNILSAAVEFWAGQFDLDELED